MHVYRRGGYKRSFGSDGPQRRANFEIADLILLIGANIADNHPILCRRLQSNPDKTVIVVDPRVTKTAMLADLHLPIRPRDLALVNALIHVVIEHGLDRGNPSNGIRRVSRRCAQSVRDTPDTRPRLPD